MKTFLKIVLLLAVAILAVKLLPVTLALGFILGIGLIVFAAVGVSLLAIGICVSLVLAIVLSPIWLPIAFILGIIGLLKRGSRKTA